MNTKLTKTMLAAACATGLAVSAQAGSFTSGIADVATQAGTFNLPVSYNFNDVSGADYYDNDSSGTLSVGDVILGTFVLDSLATTGGSTGNAGLVDVSGAYAIQVADVSPLGPGAIVTFTSVSGSPQDALVASVLGGFDAAIWEGGISTNSFANPAPGAFAPGSAWVDGDLQVGLDLAAYTLLTGGTDLAALAGLADNTTIANVGLGSSFIVSDDGSSDGGAGIGDIFENVVGSTVFVEGTVRSAGQTATPGGNSDFYFKDTATFSITATAIPSPSAMAFGLVGLGAVAIRRRRSSKA